MWLLISFSLHAIYLLLRVRLFFIAASLSEPPGTDLTIGQRVTHWSNGSVTDGSGLLTR